MKALQRLELPGWVVVVMLSLVTTVVLPYLPHTIWTMDDEPISLGPFYFCWTGYPLVNTFGDIHLSTLLAFILPFGSALIVSAFYLLRAIYMMLQMYVRCAASIN